MFRQTKLPVLSSLSHSIVLVPPCYLWSIYHIAKLSNNVEIVFEQAPFRVECCWVELKGQMLDWKSSLMKAKQVPTRFCTRQTADSASTIKVKLSNNQLSNTSDKAFIFQLRRCTLKSKMIRLQLSKYQIINYQKFIVKLSCFNKVSRSKSEMHGTIQTHLRHCTLLDVLWIVQALKQTISISVESFSSVVFSGPRLSPIASSS